MMKQISILLALAVSCLFLLSACASVNDHPASSIDEDPAVEGKHSWRSLPSNHSRGSKTNA